MTELPEAANETVRRLASGGRDVFKTNSYSKSALRESSRHDFDWIVANLPLEKAAAFIPHLPDEKIPLDGLKAFAVAHFDKAFGPQYSTFYRKLFCLYDYLAFGGKDFSG